MFLLLLFQCCYKITIHETIPTSTFIIPTSITTIVLVIVFIAVTTITPIIPTNTRNFSIHKTIPTSTLIIATSIITIVLVVIFMFLFITSMSTRDRIVASLYLWHVGKTTGAKEQA